MVFNYSTIACLLALLPGPPIITFEDAYLQLYPIKASKCPHYDLSKDVTFESFTRFNPLVAQQIVIGDDNTLANSHIDWSFPTVVYFHAFFESSTSTSGSLIRQALFLRGNFNLIMVNSRRLLAGPWYITAQQNTIVVGLHGARFLNYLYDRGLQPEMLHLVGFSLGAQAAGIAAGAAKFKPARITGLDPALPLFQNLPLTQRLDRNDAQFVDIIHTDAGGFGISAPMGHADFYINGGLSPQPGCDLKSVLRRKLILETFFCSHFHSYQIFSSSILNPYSFVGVRCDPNVPPCGRPIKNPTKDDFAYMGFAANPQRIGQFFVKTSALSPYTMLRQNRKRGY